MRHLLLIIAALGLARPALAADLAHGEVLYNARCGACHSPDADRVGPHHRGVVGRVAGTVEGFAYSPALKAAGLTWTPDLLDRWLTKPAALVPGTRMVFRVADPADRADIIAYLESLK
ncbi:cytochrome C [Oleomonas cavernae]|uniref:Cytochrome C n=2 Tax=Oleomonas cavernae TaxID=2320859 RepID=A0A418WET6_9PROT|nr:cytochrome C [Oleomonas cavernae]